ncbi:predicted protein [Sparassis crispa]|uniref:Peptidase S54 rhomboid domain-containing protein n=1 Tax=Sparassis crispa TaxID=139825 RepID=A0A401GAS1_9APHY|nr:predicted protein [Sparassis crispa]GBE79270.1 predicted protein [Sparassis crispa]
MVFVAWHLAVAKYRTTGDPSTFAFMIQNFTVSMTNIRAGRIWTLLTCCFSHKDTAHLLFNGLTYSFMAPDVMALLGNTRFLSLYLGGGLVSSALSVWWNHSVKKRDEPYGSHGASGAIYGIISFFACLAPTAKFYVFAVVPIPAWAFVTGIFLWDGFSAVYEKRSGVDTAGHIGGILAGIAYYLRLRYRLF